jgi:aspartyl-tRNA(Asn)/glutamyl-tRNA(Gln) amidotransferase subunit A
MDNDVFFATITELNARLLKKEFSCVELTRAFADRLEQQGPRYNCLALTLREQAIKKAKDVDGELKRERTRGPLQGIPYGAKDLLSVKDQPTAWGARPYTGQVFDHDATVIEKLGKKGGVTLGKLAMIQLAGGGGYRFPAASVTGACMNPWNRAHWAGGSSSGSGAAVAAGLVPYALGSETSGSILTPAAFCGLTGLRPTYGLVSRYGAMALSWTLDKIGPMCRSAEDCGLVLAAIAGGDAKDPGSAGKSFYYAPEYQRPMNEIRVGFAPVDFEGWAAPEAQADLKKALETIRSLGVRMVESRIPDFPYGPVLTTVLNGEMGAIFEPLISSGQVDQLADAKQIAGLKASLGVSAAEYLKAMRIRGLIKDAFDKAFYEEYDVILAPARTAPASRLSDPLDRGSGREAPKDRGFASLIPAGNLAGLPALSLPCGFANGLPLGIQLVTRPFNENLLLAIGKAFQAKTDFHRKRPPQA